jgi:hypothetical protein
MVRLHRGKLLSIRVVCVLIHLPKKHGETARIGVDFYASFESSKACVVML